MRYPYTLFKVKSRHGTMWHVRFWDEERRRYAHSRTTGVLAEGRKANRREAEDAAKKLCVDMIPKRKKRNLPELRQSPSPNQPTQKP